MICIVLQWQLGRGWSFCIYLIIMFRSTGWWCRLYIIFFLKLIAMICWCVCVSDSNIKRWWHMCIMGCWEWATAAEFPWSLCRCSLTEPRTFWDWKHLCVRGQSFKTCSMIHLHIYKLYLSIHTRNTPEILSKHQNTFISVWQGLLVWINIKTFNEILVVFLPCYITALDTAYNFIKCSLCLWGKRGFTQLNTRLGLGDWDICWIVILQVSEVPCVCFRAVTKRLMCGTCAQGRMFSALRPMSLTSTVWSE